MMSCHDLLNSLHDYHLLLGEINSMIKKTYQDRGAVPISLDRKTTLSYTFLRLELEAPDEGPLFLQCEFRTNEKNISCQQIFCDDKEIESMVKEMISKKIFSWEPGSKPDQYSAYKKYLTIADSIAVNGHNCSSGDDYHPGYFSKIYITEKGFMLEQINHWNAKSSAHKEDYHLRNLEFFIPFEGQSAKSSLYDYQIGSMMIVFSDRSSRNNKNCGDAILKKILEESSKF